MRKLLCLIIPIFACSCAKQKENVFPNFIANSSIDAIYKDLMPVVSDSEFCVIFFIPAEGGNALYNFFSYSQGSWEKIELRQGMIDREQQKKDPEYYISRDILTRKLCRPEEADIFLSKLKEYKLFDLPEEKALRTTCKDSGVIDSETIYILIVSGDRVRYLEYYDVYNSHERCPDVKEWNNIIKIEELFKKEWFENTLCQ